MEGRLGLQPGPRAPPTVGLITDLVGDLMSRMGREPVSPSPSPGAPLGLQLGGRPKLGRVAQDECSIGLSFRKEPTRHQGRGTAFPTKGTVRAKRHGVWLSQHGVGATGRIARTGFREKGRCANVSAHASGWWGGQRGHASPRQEGRGRTLTASPQHHSTPFWAAVPAGPCKDSEAPAL